MPTFFDSTADAAEASEALRGLAHASRTFDQPAQMYGVIGDLSSGMRSLRQVLEQLADVHERKVAHAFNDDGGHAAGVRDALATAEELRRSARLVDQAYDRLAEAFVTAGRIAWHPEPAIEEVVPSRWINVVFLQGEDADEVLDLIDRDGTAAALEHLAGYDYGDETTQAALENGYVYDKPPTGPLDRVITGEDGYTLTYNPFAGHVSLLREHHTPPADVLEDSGVVPAREAIAGIGAPEPEARQAASVPSRRAPDPSWFEHPGVAAVKQSRGLSL